MESQSTVPVAGFDPKALMEEMRKQNEAMLEAHKLQIEQQYQDQMQKFMQQFVPPPRHKGDGVLAQIKAKRPIIHDTEADEQSSRFHEHAKDRTMAPQFEQFEGDQKTHTLRAVAEGTRKNSYVVRTSGEPHESAGEIKAKAVAEKRQTAILAKKKSTVHPSLRNNPLEKSVAPAAWQKAQEDKKREKQQNAKKFAEAEVEARALGEYDHEDDFADTSASKTSSPVHVEHEDELDKFDDATRFMLKKTAFLVADQKNFARAEKIKEAKQRRKLRSPKKAKQFASTEFSNSAGGEVRNDNVEDEGTEVLDYIQEKIGYNSREGSAVGATRFPAVRTTTPLQTQGEEPQPQAKRNVLVKSVEFTGSEGTGTLPVIEPSGKIPGTHPDYLAEWEGEEEIRVNNNDYTVDPHLALHKSEWENEIARHILSVYATSHSKEDVKESKSTIKYVDIDRVETRDGVEEYVRSADGRGPYGSDVEINEGNEEGIDEVEDELGLTEKSQMLNGKGNRRPSDASDSTATSRHPTQQPGQKTAKEGGLDMTNVEKSFRNHSKYRSCLVVRVGRTGKTAGAPHNPGKEISIRGSPRCFPIWFVSSGEVYSSWARLPGGDKLQAQLFNLYEKRHFKEYLGILQKIIDDMWRVRTLGKIEGVEEFLNPRHSTRKRVTLDDSVRLVGKDGRVIQKLKDHKHKEVATAPKKPDHITGGGAWADEDPDGNVWDKIANDEKVEEAKRAELTDEDLISLWGQLILTANAFGILLIEKKSYDMALEILQNAEAWCKRSDFLPKHIRTEIMPHIYDALAFYFYKRGKNMSAMTYTNMALADHEELGNLDNICICLLHIAAIQSQAGQFKDAHKMLYQVLAMVEDGRLAFADATPKQLCLVAISYHNLAVIQMKLLVPDLACKSSQNARKIARLCLSYSNRWIHIFQWTHEAAMEDIRFQLTLKPKIPLNDQQLHVIKELTAEMYNPEAD